MGVEKSDKLLGTFLALQHCILMQRAETMNLVGYNLTLLDLRRSICGKSHKAIEVKSVEDVAITGDDNELRQSPAMQLLIRCEEFATSAVCGSACNTNDAFSLCSILMEDHVQPESESVYCGSKSTLKPWLFLALGFQLLNVLITLNSIEKTREQGGNGGSLKVHEILNMRKLLKDLVCHRIPLLLEHPEPRIRKMCSEVLFLIARDERNEYEVLIINAANHPMMHDVLQFDTTSPDVTALPEKFSRYPLYRTIGNYLLRKVTADLNRSTTSRFTTMGDESFIALDDTTGTFN